MVQYLKFFTWLSQPDIQELEAAVAQRPEQREAQRRLAREMTRIVHGETARQKAEQAAQALFGGEVIGLSASEIADIFADVPSGQVRGPRLEGEGLPIVDLLIECQVVKSKGEGRRSIDEGGIYLNNHRVADAALKVSRADAIEGQFIVLRKGRKSCWLVRVMQ